MFILNEPFVSDLLVKTINNNNYPTAYNKILEGRINEFTELNSNCEKIYTNSENSLSDAIKISSKETIDSINLFKNKTEFRRLLSKIYPDFFYKEVTLEELKELDSSKIKFPAVIKPSIGFLSFGVYTVYEEKEFKQAILSVQNSMQNSKNLFPKEVLNDEKFIIEEYIEGDEYAIDVYFDKNSKPVILNVFWHPFMNKHDVSDRMYVSSAKIIKENFEAFSILLNNIGKLTNLKNFPMHIELRKNGENIIPIEINPLRFAGWCTTDLAYFAYGINVYEYFMENKTPDWDSIFEKHKDDVFAFVMAEVPLDIKKEDIKSFNIEKWKKDTKAKILDQREFDFKTKPMFSVLFVKNSSFENLKNILNLDVHNYINF